MYDKPDFGALLAVLAFLSFLIWWDRRSPSVEQELPRDLPSIDYGHWPQDNCFDDIL